jgi:hypothetical protein
VEKQRRLRNNPMLFSDKADPGSVPMAGVWNQPDSLGLKHAEAEDVHADSSQELEQSENQLHGGTVLVRMGRTSIRKPVRPLAAGLTGAD